ncbi:hypothetical protein D1J36_001415 [Riemerella anatipestifer]|uniref:hypothetical protein n=1 Tax=Riemerella anatipestifer TaxID=34085 RepID=UPI0012ADB294|nr:hypothetical protein [Riemerella anatipestifer]USL96493.1 hypothetical protein D1J36_001415 [Riemerella anatipestifer]
MKTTATKLSVLAFLGLGLAVYGQDYSGKVGINISTPSATLDVKSKSSASKSFRVENTSGTETVTVLDNGNVGVGVASPTVKLDVAGAVKIADGTQQAGRVLTSDANGLASWQALSIGNKMAKIVLSNNNFTVPTVKSGGSLVAVKEKANNTIIYFDEIGITYNADKDAIHLPQGKYMFFVGHDIYGAEYCFFQVNEERNGTVVGTPYATFYEGWLNTSFPLILSQDADISFSILGFADDNWVDDGTSRNLANPNPRFYLKASEYVNTSFFNSITILKLN